jgi:hypothetical protein
MIMVASNALVYGEPKADIDIFSWDRLRFLRAQWNGPWVCIGDFNEVLSSDEHLGVSAKGEAQMQQFWDCLEDCQLVDLGFFVLDIHGIIDYKGSTTFMLDWIGLWLMVFLLKCLRMLSGEYNHNCL